MTIGIVEHVLEKETTANIQRECSKVSSISIWDTKNERTSFERYVMCQ